MGEFKVDMQEVLKLKGSLCIEHRRNGMLIDVRNINNTVMNTGKAGVAGLVCNQGTVSSFGYMAIGTGTSNSGDATQTQLGTEITTYGGARAATTNSRVTTTVTNDTAQFVLQYSFTAGASFAITESGIFNNASAGQGIMLCRQVFAAINVVSGDSLTITWKVAFS